MSSEDFYCFKQKILEDSAKIVSWCPTFDLVLIVSHDNAISLYRSKFQQLTLVWNSEGVESDIEAATWKPNGKELVFGCQNGTVYIVDTAQEPLQIKECWSPKDRFYGAIRYLYWTAYARHDKKDDIKGFDIKAFDLELNLPLLNTHPPTEPKPLFLTRAKKKSFPKKPSEKIQSHTILLVGTDQGHIHIILNGIYPIGNIHMEHGDILNMNAETYLKSLQVFFKSKKTKDYCLSVVDTHALQEKRREILTISRLQTQLNYLFDYAIYSVDILKKHYDVCTRHNKRVINHAMDVTVNNSGDIQKPMPEVELIMLLATGGLSPVTKQLLQECLTPQFIKQWESTNMQGYRQILLILCEYVLPSLEQILLELSHLLGYGRWKERYSDFLEPTRIEEWIKSIQKLIVYTRELTDKLRRLLKIFEAFTQWLHIISLKLSDTDSEELKSLSSLCKEPELVFEYLEEWFIHDKLAEYFIDANGKSITTQLSDLSKCCSGLLDEPLETLSKKMLVKSINPFRLGKTPSSDNCSLAFASTKDNTSQSTYYAFIEPGQKVIILKSSFTKSSFQYACILVPDTISDVKFFDFRELCIVTHNQQNTTLQTVYLDKIKYKNCISNFANNLGNEQLGRKLVLEGMIQTKLGCNGLPKRRIFATVASNGMLSIYSMENIEL